jgi:hypothetical protein
MAQYTKTLKLRIKDKHSKVLCQWAFEVNQVWNVANEISADYSWVPIPVIDITRDELLEELAGFNPI